MKPRQLPLLFGMTLGAFAAFQIEGLFEWNFGDAEVVMLLWFSVGLALAGKRLAESSPAGSSSKGLTRGAET